MKIALTFFGFVFGNWAIAQSDSSFRWWSPTEHEFQVIEGQAWFDELASPYDRLPKRSANQVALNIWQLSKHSAGLMIRFRSNAEEIKVRYKINGENLINLDHMPATGVVDWIYAINSDGMEVWCGADRIFGDTVIYSFLNLNANDGYHDRGRIPTLFTTL